MRWHSQQRVAEAMRGARGCPEVRCVGLCEQGPVLGAVRQYCGTWQGRALSSWGSLPLMRRGRAMLWWTSGCSCLTRGGPTRMLPSGPMPPPQRTGLSEPAAMGGDDAAGHRPCRAPPNSERRGGWPLWPEPDLLDAVGTRVSASRRSSRFRRKRAAGANAPERRTRPTPIQETCAPSVVVTPTHAPSSRRRWRHTCLRRAGLSAPFQKGPRGP